MKKIIFFFIIGTLIINFSSKAQQGNIKIVIDNSDFLLLKDNSPNTIITYTSTFMCSTEQTLNINWKVNEQGTVGAVKIYADAADLDFYLNTPNTLKFLKVADDETFSANIDYVPVKLEIIDNIPQYTALYDFNGTKYFTYSELNAIVWSGNTTTWQGGTGTNGAPHQDNDNSKLLIIDGGTSYTNAFISTPTNINCAWIKTGSKLIINNNNSLTVQNQLQLDGELRMVGNAQLLQKHTGNSQISGLGKIYIDQLGTTTTTYRYNYWSSPVVETGLNTFAVGNVMKDGTIPTSENSTPLNINYTTDYDGSKTSPITIADYWIFTYYNGTTGYDWVQKKSDLNITPPLGFIMKGPGDGTQNYTFVGTPNDGDYSSTISAGKLSLLGNPYPSALDAEKFIEDNVSSILGTIYFWEMEGDSGNHYAQGYIGGYGIKNLAMGIAANTEVTGTAGLGDIIYQTPGRYIPVGQGFFVSSSTGGIINFNNTQRYVQPIDGNQSLFFKSKEEDQTIIGQSNKSNNAIITDKKNQKSLSQLKLGFEYQDPDGKDIHRQIGLTFNPNNSFAFDNGYDSFMFDPQPTDMYFKFKDDPSKYVAAGVGSFDKSLEIPIEIDISLSGNFNFMIDYIDDLKNNKAIYLKDALNRRFYDLSDGVKTLNLNSGTYQNRFFITFKKKKTSDNHHHTPNNLLIYYDRTTSEIILYPKGLTIKKITLINLVRSKKIFTWKNIKNNDKIILPIKNISDGIYLIKLNTNKGLISKKVFIFN